MFGNKNDKVNEKRFEIVTEQTVNLIGLTVFRDKLTGINYIAGQGINGFGITPLLDKEGKPLVTQPTYTNNNNI